MLIKFLAGPLIGAIIGYFTNFIAVKMLFLPKNEIKVLGHRLPLTPGAIPKGKPRLARAVGDIVGNTLITKEDIEVKLKSEELMRQISASVMEELSHTVKSSVISLGKCSEESYENVKEKLEDLVSKEIITAILNIDLSSILVEKGSAVVLEKVKGTMLQMLVSEERIQLLLAPMGEEIEKLIEEQGMNYVQPAINERFSEIEEKSSMELLKAMNIAESKITEIVTSVFDRAIIPFLEKGMNTINISQIVEDKINAMLVDELEQIVLAVMKKELNLIVNLGALIGFILGMLNTLF